MSDLRKMTPAELFDEIHADGLNFSEGAHRARLGGLEALRRVQELSGKGPTADPTPTPETPEALVDVDVHVERILQCAAQDLARSALATLTSARDAALIAELTARLDAANAICRARLEALEALRAAGAPPPPRVDLTPLSKLAEEFQQAADDAARLYMAEGGTAADRVKAGVFEQVHRMLVATLAQMPAHQPAAGDGPSDGEDEAPYVCPGCHAVGGGPCAPGCIDAAIEAKREQDRNDRFDEGEDGHG